MPRPMTMREGEAMDRYITGNYGEDYLLAICPDCGSADVVEEDGLYDCLTCGCCFDPEHPEVQVDQQEWRVK